MRALAQAQTIPTSLPARFRSHIVVDPATGCWLWTGSNQGRQGYGIYKVAVGDQRWVMAHRFCYEFIIGPIPQGLVLDHGCLTEPCVNPFHVQAVTSRINTLRGNSPPAVNARKIFCKRGHLLVGGNLYRKVRNGWPVRECRTCNRLLARRYRAKRKNLFGAGESGAVDHRPVAVAAVGTAP